MSRRTGWVRPFVSALVVVLIAGSGGWWWARAHQEGLHFSAEFTSSVGVYPGSDVRMLGVSVGAVDSVTPRGTLVVVRMHVDPGVAVAADTEAAVVSPNLVSDRYVALTGVWVSGAKLAANAVIPLSRTATPVEIDQLYRSLLTVTTALGPAGANAATAASPHGSLSDLLTAAAANLSGNGSQLKTTITALGNAASTLGSTAPDFFATIDNLDSFTRNLSANDASLSTLNSELAQVSQVLADDRGSFAAALHDLDSALTLVHTFITANHDTLSTDVSRLAGFAQQLADAQASVSKALQTAPLLTQNFANAYDPSANVLYGRANLNELTIWASTGTTSSSAARSSDSTAPPTLLPGVGSGG